MIALEFKNNNSWHNDIVFRLDDFEKICDSYYFLIDTCSEEENLKKILSVIVLLLEQWTKAIESLEPGRTIYLPYDFSDQSTGCVRATWKENKIELTGGYSYREGWTVWPSDISDYIQSISDFTAVTSAISLTREELITQLLQSIANIRKQQK